MPRGEIRSVFYCCLDLPLPVKAGLCLLLLLLSAVSGLPALPWAGGSSWEQTEVTPVLLGERDTCPMGRSEERARVLINASRCS